MKKTENYVLKTMSPDMVKLYSLVKNLTPCDNLGGCSEKEDNYMVYPRRQNQLYKIQTLLSRVGIVKIIEFKSNDPQTKDVLMLPYKFCRIPTQKIAVKNLLNAFHRMDSIGFLMEHGGFELSPAEAEYFAKKVKIR